MNSSSSSSGRGTPKKTLDLSSDNDNDNGSNSNSNTNSDDISNSDSNSSSSSNSNTNNEKSPPILTFGVLADIQYAPIPNGYSFNGTPRYYRHALTTASHAAQHFEKEEVCMVVNLGDIIDGKCQEIDIYCKEEIEHIDTNQNTDTNINTDTEEETKQQQLFKYINSSNPGHDAVDDVLNALSLYKRGPMLHTYGNHELYNLSRIDIANKLGIPFVKEPCGDLVGYYTQKSPCNNLRFVILDSYDISVMGRCPNTSIKRKKAEALLSQHNPNFPEVENSPQGLDGVQKRYVAFNGAIDNPQLEWLRCTLKEAKKNNEKVIILSHQPIIPESSGDVCLMWNYNDVLDILREYKDIVAAAFAGHAHKGGYRRDKESGIHFRVFEAVLESKDPVKTYAFVDYHHDRLVIRGCGDCEGATYDLDHLSFNPKL